MKEERREASKDATERMTRSPQQLELPGALRDLILSAKKCVAFIGSGLSAGCYDSWPNLVNKLCERCGCSSRVQSSDPVDAFLDAAQDAKDANEGAYYEFLGEHFGKRAPSIPRQYLSMWSLRFRCYLTVNLDPLLSLVSRATGNDSQPKIYAYPSLDRGKMKDGSIHYLHGYIEEQSKPKAGSIVLTRREFDDAYANNSNLMTFLCATLEHDPIVFIGCGLREPVMPRVFQISKENQERRMKLIMECGGNSVPPPRFIFLPWPEVKDSRGHVDEKQSRTIAEGENERFEEMCITPVRYLASGGDHSVLWSAVEQLGSLSKLAPDHGWDGDTYGT